LRGIAATAQVGTQKLRLDAAVTFALAPVPEEAIAQTSLCNRRGEQLDHTVLSFAFRARYSISHGILSNDGETFNPGGGSVCISGLQLAFDLFDAGQIGFQLRR